MYLIKPTHENIINNLEERSMRSAGKKPPFGTFTKSPTTT